VAEPEADPRVVELFTELDGDEPGNLQPELHLIGLSGKDVIAVVEHLNQRGAQWNDSTFHIDREGVDVTVSDRPDVAQLVVSGQAGHACVGADGIRLDETELPTLSMFIHPQSIEFFWETGSPWRAEHVPAFLALMRELLALAPNAALRPDPALVDDYRHAARGRHRMPRPHRLRRPVPSGRVGRRERLSQTGPEAT
jgi:hypothetical protein